jgi:hypothetical protein
VEFKRSNPAGRTFSGGGFKIIRPSGPTTTRSGLGLKHRDHAFEIRRRDDEIWLIDGEREVGYAAGAADDWRLLFGERAFEIVQPTPGRNNSALMLADKRVGEIDGSGFPLRAVELTIRSNLSEEEQAFVVMIALLGWRESDRSLFSSIQTTSEGPAGP